MLLLSVWLNIGLFIYYGPFYAILMHMVLYEIGQGTLLTATGEFLLPLLTLPKSLDPFLTILLHGMLTVYR